MTNNENLMNSFEEIELATITEKIKSKAEAIEFARFNSILLYKFIFRYVFTSFFLF